MLHYRLLLRLVFTSPVFIPARVGWKENARSVLSEGERNRRETKGEADEEELGGDDARRRWIKKDNERLITEHYVCRLIDEPLGTEQKKGSRHQIEDCIVKCLLLQPKSFVIISCIHLVKGP